MILNISKIIISILKKIIPVSRMQSVPKTPMSDSFNVGVLIGKTSSVYNEFID